jgi:hypothetical protein
LVELLARITRLNYPISSLVDRNNADLSLYISNNGNLKYDGKLDIVGKSDDRILKSLDLSIDPGEVQSMNINLDISASTFGTPETAEDGSVSDKIELLIKAGEYTRDAEIVRVVEKSIVDSVNNVESFSIDRSYLSIYEGSVAKLNANTVLKTPIPEYTADPLQVKWRTSNADVASVLPDGTVIGLSEGTATITATLMPRDDTMITLEDGSIATIDTSYKYPSNMLQEKTINVTVLRNTEPDDESNGTNNGSTGSSGGNSGTAGTEQSGQPGKYSETKSSDKGVLLEIEPVTDNRTSTITPSESAIADALQKLKEENKTTLIFAVADKDDNATGKDDDGNIDLETSKLLINSGVISAIADSQISTVTFETPLGSMSIGKETIDELKRISLGTGSEEQQDISIQISKVAPANYPDKLKELIGDRPVYDFSIMVGDKKLKDVSDTPVALTLELDNMPEEDPSVNENQIVGAYITEDGEYKLIPLSALIDGKLVIKTSHNSIYAGLYNKVQFKDVSGWSEDYIAFLSARGIINGKGNGNFAPKDNITRCEFVKIMAMIADADVSQYAGSSFKDVDADKWYAPYIEWAYTTGLVNGVGGGMFAPDRNILREEMAVLLSRFAEKLEFNLPEINEEMKFKDSSEIAEYARTSVKLIQKSGIINGRPDGTFAPKDNAIREEAAKVFTELIKLIVK